MGFTDKVFKLVQNILYRWFSILYPCSKNFSKRQARLIKTMEVVNNGKEIVFENEICIIKLFRFNSSGAMLMIEKSGRSLKAKMLKLEKVIQNVKAKDESFDRVRIILSKNSIFFILPNDQVP